MSLTEGCLQSILEHFWPNENDYERTLKWIVKRTCEKTNSNPLLCIKQARCVDLLPGAAQPSMIKLSGGGSNTNADKQLAWN